MLSRGFLVQPWFPSCAGTLSSCSSISEFAIANNKVWGLGSATDYKIWRGFLSAASTQVEHFPSRQKSCCFFFTFFFFWPWQNCVFPHKSWQKFVSFLRPIAKSKITNVAPAQHWNIMSFFFEQFCPSVQLIICWAASPFPLLLNTATPGEVFYSRETKVTSLLFKRSRRGKKKSLQWLRQLRVWLQQQTQRNRTPACVHGQLSALEREASQTVEGIGRPAACETEEV